jgi:hypothetical protein
MPNTTYTRKPDPARRMRPDQPKVICDACRKKGHGANTCDFLAMSIFLQRFMKHGMANKESIAEAEQRWVERAKDLTSLVTPHRLRFIKRTPNAVV